MADHSRHSLRPSVDGRFVWPLLLVLVFAGCIFFTNLGAAQLWDRDEPRNAGCAAEMLDRADPVVPIFNGELRGQKPVLLYWLMMGAYQVLGVNEFSARVWSALLSVGTVGITFSIGHRLFGPKVAWLSGIILASNLMFAVVARAATPDALLIFLSTLTIAIYVWGSIPRPSGGFPLSFSALDGRLRLAMGVSMGLAMLAKGPVGFVMPMAIMGMHLLIIRSDRTSRRFAILAVVHPIHFIKTTLAMHPFLLLAIALLVALPWYVLVGIRTEGDFLNLFFLKEHWGRSTNAFENHSGGVWFYPLSILIGFFPWSLFWLPVAIVLWRGPKNDAGANEPGGKESGANVPAANDAVALMLCWVGVQVGIFSIAQTKLPSYVAPCYPALSILTAVGLDAWVQGRATIADAWMKAAWIIGILAGVTMAIATAIAAAQHLPSALWSPVIGAAMTGGSVAGLWKLSRGDRSQAVHGFTAGTACFIWLLFGFGTGSLSTAQNNRLILDRVAALPPHVAVASYHCLESSWPFYSKRTIFETFGDAPPLLLSRAKYWKPKPVTSPESFASQNQQCVFITTDEFSDQLLERLPDGFAVQQTADYFLKDQKLVMIGR